ncbi:MAG: hypothetical protein WC222_06335 [Parachlamydiales bacterium]|jgi:hypothetical protein
MSQGPLQQLILKLTRRQDRLHLATLLIYLIPLLLLTLIAVWIVTPAAGWPLLPLSLFLAATGSLVILTLWRLREGSLLQNLPHQETAEKSEIPSLSSQDSDEKILRFQQSLEEYRQEQQRYLHEIDEKASALDRLMQENSLLHSTLDGAREKHHRENSSLVEQIQQQKTLLEEYQHTINNQRQEISKLEQNIASLENRVRDLTYQLRDQKYEIKTLLQLADMPQDHTTHSHEGEDWLEEIPSLPVLANRHSIEQDTPEEEFISSPGEASLILKRCLDIARKITGPSYFSPSHAPFGHPSTASHTLDLRRLCDSLRSERGAVVLVYSPKDDKLLFISPTIKLLSGWNSDKFAQDFYSLLGEQSHEWRNAVRRLPVQGETSLTIHLNTKDNRGIKLQAFLGAIPTGLFRLHTLAVLFPVS